MSDIKRISVEEGAALFERTGLVPCPRIYLCAGDDKYGCLAGAFVADVDGFESTLEGLRKNRAHICERMAEIGFDREYVAGLIYGFDCPLDVQATRLMGRTDSRGLGFADGAAIRRCVLPVPTEGQPS